MFGPMNGVNTPKQARSVNFADNVQAKPGPGHVPGRVDPEFTGNPPAPRRWSRAMQPPTLSDISEDGRGFGRNQFGPGSKSDFSGQFPPGHKRPAPSRIPKQVV